MNTDHLTRQLTLIPMDTLDVPVTIIGCGAVGSFLALSLAKMGITQIEVFDHDVVSIENMSNQGFRFKDIGKQKAQALAEIVSDYTNVKLVCADRKFTQADMAGRKGIVISAVDSMKARQMIWDGLLNEYNMVKWLIDPRMSAEFFTLFCMNPADAKDRVTYAKNLFKDEDAVPTPCTAKSTVYTATLAAGLVVKTIKNLILNETYPRQIHWDIKAVENSMTMYAK